MIKNSLKFLLAVLALASLVLAPTVRAAGKPVSDPIKIVYHINDASNASALLNNVKNNLNAMPGTKIAVVAHGKGIDFMLDNAEDANGNPYSVTMETLASQGVDFKVCNNTLKSRNLTAADVAYPVKIVPSGVAEVARLQANEGYAYLKP